MAFAARQRAARARRPATALSFLGRNGSLARPAALRRARALRPLRRRPRSLRGAARRGRARRPGRRGDSSSCSGRGGTRAEARELVAPARRRSRRRRPRSRGRGRVLGRDPRAPSRCSTPDDSFDLLMNRWLLYQDLGCRLLGPLRLLPAGRRLRLPRPAPGRAWRSRSRGRTSRASTCCARRSRQFVEGDVQHWWHEPSGRGTRTRCSDDLLWLPFAVAALRPRRPATRRSWTRRCRSSRRRRSPPARRRPTRSPRVSAEQASLFEHCLRAIDKGLTAGAHGLPLIGSGDWNDGMNRVGREGRGESIWLGFFLHVVLREFAPLCEARGDGPRRALPGGGEAAGHHARAGLGRRVVPARLLRRRHAAGLGAERRVPDRLHRPVVGRAVGRGAHALRRARDGRGAHPPGAARPRVLLAPHAALRPVGAGSRLHQGLSAGRARERRPVHPRRGVGRDGDGPPGQRRRGGRALPHAQPRQPHADPGRRRALQGRAVRARRRRLRPPRPRRARRLDLVHGLRGLDVPRRPREHPRACAARRVLRDRSLHPVVVARLRDRLAVRRARATRSRSRTRSAAAAASRRRSWTAPPSIPRPSRWSTTARPTRCGWCWARASGRPRRRSRKARRRPPSARSATRCGPRAEAGSRSPGGRTGRRRRPPRPRSSCRGG